MSDVKVGDLVVVVKPMSCCPEKSKFGTIFQVTGFFHGFRCSHCGEITLIPVALRGDGYARELHRLRRIPPLSELETTEHKEELTA